MKRRPRINVVKPTDVCPGALDRIRTGDLVLTKDVLYQLSYKGGLGQRPNRKRGPNLVSGFSTVNCFFGNFSMTDSNTVETRWKSFTQAKLPDQIAAKKSVDLLDPRADSQRRHPH